MPKTIPAAGSGVTAGSNTEEPDDTDTSGAQTDQRGEAPTDDRTEDTTEPSTPHLTQVLTAIASQLRTAFGNLGWNIHRHPPQTVAGDLIYLVPDLIDYNITGGGPKASLSQYSLTVEAVSRSRQPSTTLNRLHQLLDPGPGGLRAAIEEDRTLGGLVQTLTVKTGRIGTPFSSPDAERGAAQFEIEVLL